MRFAILSLLLAGTMSAAEPARPNILFIFSDDQSHRTVGCYPEAYDWVKTPNIDKLAKSGVRFTHASHSSWCMPSRAIMLTGLHPYGVESMRSVGKYPGSTYDPKLCKFWPATFRENGYVTAQIGKWHTGTDTGFGRDWDHQIVWNRPMFPDNSTHYYDNQMITRDGGKPELTKGYSTDNYTNWTIDFINGQNRDPKKPWYLWLCYGAVHSAYEPAERHKKDYPGVKVPVPADIYPPRPGKPDYMQKIETWTKDSNGEPALKKGKTLNESVRQVQQCVNALDEGIGRVLDALEKSGQLKNTLVVYTADQGFAWGQHGFSHKLAPYESNMRAPFIVSMPGVIPAGEVCTTPVGGVDLPPTFFQFAGIKQPWAMHGHDLSPLFKNPKADWQHPVLLAHTHDHFGSATAKLPADGDRHNEIPWWISFRKGQYKYIRTLETNQIDELYDVIADPEELTNLAIDPKNADRVKEYREAMVKELERTQSPLAKVLPPVK